MPEHYYRLYLLDDRGHFRSVIEFDAADDHAAITEAELREQTHAKELWCGARLVKSWRQFA